MDNQINEIHQVRDLRNAIVEQLKQLHEKALTASDWDTVVEVKYAFGYIGFELSAYEGQLRPAYKGTQPQLPITANHHS